MTLITVLQSPSKRRQTRQQLQEEAALQAEQETAAAEKAYRDLVWEAQDYIKAFVKERWSAHWSLVTIEGAITIDELRELGRLPKTEGTRECRKLVRVPVINESVGIALWERLAEELENREKEIPAVRDGEHSRAGPSEQQTTMRRESNLSVVSNKEKEKKRNEDDHLRKGSHFKRRRTSEHSRKGKEKEPSQQPAKRTCVFCRNPVTLRCQIPADLLVGQAVVDQVPADVSDHDVHERWQKLFTWVRRSSDPNEEAVSPTEEPFWHKKELIHPAPAPISKEENMPCGSLKRVSLVEKVLGKSHAMTIQKTLESFGESLAYGYGSRQRSFSEKRRCDSASLFGGVL